LGYPVELGEMSSHAYLRVHVRGLLSNSIAYGQHQDCTFFPLLMTYLRVDLREFYVVGLLIHGCVLRSENKVCNLWLSFGVTALFSAVHHFML
jgi:hypothetical protein